MSETPSQPTPGKALNSQSQVLLCGGGPGLGEWWDIRGPVFTETALMPLFNPINPGRCSPGPQMHSFIDVI